MKERKKIFLNFSNNVKFYKNITNKKLYNQETWGRFTDDNVWWIPSQKPKL